MKVFLLVLALSGCNQKEKENVSLTDSVPTCEDPVSFYVDFYVDGRYCIYCDSTGHQSFGFSIPDADIESECKIDLLVKNYDCDNRIDNINYSSANIDAYIDEVCRDFKEKKQRIDTSVRFQN